MRQTHLQTTCDINCNQRRHIEDRNCAVACVWLCSESETLARIRLSDCY